LLPLGVHNALAGLCGRRKIRMGRCDVQLWDHSRPGIYIDATASQSFFHATSRDLNKLASKPIGRDLLSLISKRCQGIGTKVVNGKVVIKLGMGTLGGDESWEQTQASPDDFDKVGIGSTMSRVGGTLSNFKLAGAGSSCEAFYNPNLQHQYDLALGIKTPTFIALGHELIHALHSLSGDMYTDTSGNIVVIREEARTCGLGIYSTQRISENALRKEHGIGPPYRTYYSDPGDTDGLVGIST
jgi:hypothetical protein